MSIEIDRAAPVADGYSKALPNLRNAAFAVALVSMAVAAAVASLLGLTWEMSGFAGVAIAASFPLLLGCVISHEGGISAKAGDSLSLLGLLFMLTYCCGAIAIMSTRSPAAMADGWLNGLDRSLGLSAPALIGEVSAGPRWLIELLKSAYASGPKIVLATLLILPFIGQRRAAWRFGLLYGLTLLFASLISFAAPAIGSFTLLDPATIARLPTGAGLFASDAMMSFRTADDPLVSINAIAGVVCFPSFHTILALLLIEAWKEVRFVGPVMIGWSATVIVSTLPIGGHYFIDLIAGALLWWSCSRLVRRIERAEPIRRFGGTIVAMA